MSNFLEIRKHVDKTSYLFMKIQILSNFTFSLKIKDNVTTYYSIVTRLQNLVLLIIYFILQ